MFFRTGPGSSGYNYAPEYMDADGRFNIPAGATLVPGQPFARDVTQVPSSAGADVLVLPTNANAGPIQGVYQGNPILNPSSVNPFGVDIVMRVRGYGQLWAGAAFGGTAVTVGSNMALVGNRDAALAASGGQGSQIGIALATGNAIAKGATIIAVPGSGTNYLLINAYINCN